MGGLLSRFSRVSKARLLKNPKFVPITSRYDPNTVRKLEIEVYLPPVLSNIALQYFSKQWNIATFETIYNEENDLEESWDCSLSKAVVTGNESNNTFLSSEVLVQDNGKSVVRIRFRSTKSSHTQSEIVYSQVTPTNVEFVTLDSFYYDLYSFHLENFVLFPTNGHTQTQNHALVTFVEFLKCLDGGIAEFQHPILLNIKALIDAHHAALAGCWRKS